MIEKLDRHIREEDGVRISCPPTQTYCMDKINELVDTVNKLQESVQGMVDNSIKDGGRIRLPQEQIHALKTTMANNSIVAENCESAKNAHKSDLEEALEGFPGLFKSNKDEPLVDAVMQEAKENHKIRSTNERLRKALDCAIDTLDTVYGLLEDNSNIETYIKCKRIEINGIIKGGKDE